MKPGKVVLVLGGRYAGRKAVIVKVCYLYLCRQKLSFFLTVINVSSQMFSSNQTL